MPSNASKPIAGHKLRGSDKVARIPIKVIATTTLARKPDWIRTTLSNPEQVNTVKTLLREQKLATVCEEAACPNLSECFGAGTATFMIMGEICTRRCPFCDVAHGRPLPLDPQEPDHLAQTVARLGLNYVVITSVDRDDLADGGANHFAECIKAIRALSPNTRIEILVPDFKGRKNIALQILADTPPDVFNHNIETVPRLYQAMRPGSDYLFSLDLLAAYKRLRPEVRTKCGLMVGLGEDTAEVEQVLSDLAAHQVDMVTIGQYLQPSKAHAALHRYVHPSEFLAYQQYGVQLGFSNIWSAPMVRSSYFADKQYQGLAQPAIKGNWQHV